MCAARSSSIEPIDPPKFALHLRSFAVSVLILRPDKAAVSFKILWGFSNHVDLLATTPRALQSETDENIASKKFAVARQATPLRFHVIVWRHWEVRHLLRLRMEFHHPYRRVDSLV